MGEQLIELGINLFTSYAHRLGYDVFLAVGRKNMKTGYTRYIGRYEPSKRGETHDRIWLLCNAWFAIVNDPKLVKGWLDTLEK